MLEEWADLIDAWAKGKKPNSGNLRGRYDVVCGTPDIVSWLTASDFDLSWLMFDRVVSIRTVIDWTEDHWISADYQLAGASSV